MAKYRIPSDYKNDVSKALHNWYSNAGGTQHPGLAYPVHHRHMNTGDRIRGRISELNQSQPMEGPLLNGFKRITIATFTPDSVLYGWMRNGKRFSPTDYRDFVRFYFRASGSDFPAYADPVFSSSRPCPRLAYGFLKSNAAVQNYMDWVDDTKFNASSSVSAGGRVHHVGRGGLWEWLGVPAGAVAPSYGVPNSLPRDSPSMLWTVEPFFAYFLSCYYYIANMQEKHMFFTRGLADIYTNTIAKGSLAQLPFDVVFSGFDPDSFLDFIDALASYSRSGGAFEIGNVAANGIVGVPKTPVVAGMLTAGLQAHGGLLAVPYSPDLFGNIIRQGLSPDVYIPVIEDPEDSGSQAVGVPELRLQTKIQNWLDRLFVSGGRWGDVLRTLWGTKSSPYINKPDFLGVWQTSVNPSNVVATANGTADGLSANVGQMAARIDRFSDFSGTQGIDYYADEPGTFMLISMLVPDPAYCQGLHPDLYGTSFADDFNPELVGLGFQSVPRHRFTMLPTVFEAPASGSNPWINDTANMFPTDPNVASVGEEVAWSWLRTDYPRLHGEFAQNGVFQYWTLVRRFSEYYTKLDSSGSLDGVNTYDYYGSYVNPLSWQYIFAGQSFADANFVYLANYDLKIVSSLPSNYMPYLGR